MSLVQRALNKAKTNSEVPKSKPKQAQVQEQSKAQNNIDTQTEYALFKAAMTSDLAQLKTFSDISDKADYKAKAIEKNDYLGFLTQYRLRGDNYPNMVLAWVFVWLVDLKRWNQAIELLPLLIEQKQPLPTVFSTKHWPTFLIDQLYDDANYYLQNSCTKNDLANMAFTLQQVIHATRHQNWEGSEIAGGKLYAIATKLEATQHNYGNAVRFGKIAQQINEKAGVKTLIEKIEKKYLCNSSNASGQLSVTS
ncbi:phage terminase small subunit [Pseudoalteromonas sp. S16_S37]|uniref:phage terminase small subunit n=1 Tax=Pseudoalteromonas sp. S16_S37 TaxID=2720228 RepID=UPI001680CA25|nr:phage terminase small subunit [Pseudoalteromonas sp. S16_S37]MBD1582792.1 terminase [Pseudoalteromonas sp. S16_S37]